MNRNMKQLVIGVIILVVGIFVGRMMGAAEAYKKSSGAVAEQYLRATMANLNSHLGLLELLKGNQPAKATEKLENLIDADINALKRRQAIPAELEPQVRQAVERGEAYRQKMQPGAGSAK